MSTSTHPMAQAAAMPHRGPEAVLHSTVSLEAVDDEAFALGIVRLSPERRVTYVNKSATRMTGGEVKPGMLVGELLLDDASRATMTAALNQRFQSERGSTYHIRFMRRDLGTYVRIRISAVPEYDHRGECIGSIGYFIDESIDTAAVSIHMVIANAKDGNELLAEMTQQLREILSFDTLLVTGISQSRHHLSRVFEHPPPPPEITPTLWWPMPQFVKAMIDGCEAGPLDLEKMFATPEFVEYAKTDPSIEQFRNRGFKHCLRIGVYRANVLVAMLSVMRRAAIEYTSEDVERCKRLPLVEAVNTALAFEQQRSLKFGVDFVENISQASDSYHAIAQMLVDQLARHYGWNHVSLFRLHRDGKRFDLVCQAGKSRHRVADGYSQEASAGFLGQAFIEKQPVNIGFVQDEKYASCRPLLAETRAEMVLPVPGTESRWLLNVESELRDAFADEEQQAAEVQLRIAGFILERVASLESKTAILKSVADAVIQTNDDDVIVDANPAAEALFGYPLEELRDRNLAHFLAVEPEPISIPSASRALAKPGATALAHIVEHPEPFPIKLRRKDGVLIPVLMSAALLPERMGGKVFVAGDLREQNRVQRMEVLNNVFHQLASEIRVPLALCDAFLTEALTSTLSGSPRELIDKSLRQVRKADMPLERMVRLAVRDQDSPLPRINFDLRDAIERMIAEFPQGDAAGIRLLAQSGFPVETARHELLFCVRSLLTYLLRRKAQVEQVEIQLGRHGADAVMSLTVPPAASDAAHVSVGLHGESDLEMTLAEPVLFNLMNRMGGGYSPLGESRRGFQLHFNAG